VQNSDVSSFNVTILPLDERAMQGAKNRWMQLCKPLFSLGMLEDIVIRLAGIQNQVYPKVQRKAIVIFAADNGVVSQGVTQCGQEVTAQVTANFIRGIATINALAKVAGADLYPVDVGINQPERLANVIDRRIRQGTADFCTGPAMTRSEVFQALKIGYEQAVTMKELGYDLVGAGEMGIGNTTTSSAVLSVLTGRAPGSVTGRGAGLSDEQLNRKIQVIEAGIHFNQPDPANPIDVLQKVGGLDLASMVGFYLGAAANRLPVLVDGFIASVAAVAAVRIHPIAKEYLFASHLSTEPGAAIALAELNLPAYINCGMRVGEGTGCCVAFGLFDHAIAAYQGIATFAEAGVGAYKPLSEKK